MILLFLLKCPKFSYNYIMYKFIVLILLLLCTLSINTTLAYSYLLPEENSNTTSQTDLYEISPTFEPVFTFQNIPEHIYEKMLGNSIPFEYKDEVDSSSLSYLQVSYWGFDNNSHVGEIIVNSKLENDVLTIFMELYDIKYLIEKIKLIDEYNANDELSMSDNNTSCFCYRTIAGQSALSNHSKRSCNRYKSSIQSFRFRKKYQSCFWFSIC